MKNIMRLLLSGAVLTVALCFNVPASQAYYGNGPWCAVISVGTGGVVWDCQYRTVEECVPHVLAGNRGFCNPSPYYVARMVAPRKHRTRHARPN